MSGDHVIVHLLGVLDRGGVEMRTLEIVRAFDVAGTRTVMCTLSGRRGELAPLYESAGAEVVPLSLRSPFFVWHFWRLLRGLPAGVVHSYIHYSSGPLLLLAWMAGVPTRIAQFSSDSSGRATVSPLRRAYYAFAKGLIVRVATDIVGLAPSSLSANWSDHVRHDSRFQVVPSGVSAEHLTLTGTVDVRRELGVSANSRLVIHVGRADIPTKNRELAVEVLRNAVDAGLDVTLAFIGRNGSDPASVARHRQLVERIAQYALTDRVVIAGERSDVGAIMNQADALLVTSTLEGLPGVVIEASACGLPVVSSDVPGSVFIANQLEGIALVDRTSPPPCWVSALESALDVSGGHHRDIRREAFLASPFNLPNSLENYRRLWRC